MDAQKIQEPEKVSRIWVKVLNKIVNKMNNTVSSIIGMKPKDAIKLDAVLLDKKYLEENVLPGDVLYRYLYQLVNNIETKQDKQYTLFGVKIHID